MKNEYSILILICIQSYYFIDASSKQVREYMVIHKYTYIYIYIYIYILSEHITHINIHSHSSNTSLLLPFLKESNFSIIALTET